MDFDADWLEKFPMKMPAIRDQPMQANMPASRRHVNTNRPIVA